MEHILDSVWKYRVVPISVEFVALDSNRGHLFVRNLHPLWYLRESTSAWTRSPARVVVAAIRFTITWWLTSGLPRQFWLMKENSRCSILFHLLVPGGR